MRAVMGRWSEMRNPASPSLQFGSVPNVRIAHLEALSLGPTSERRIAPGGGGDGEWSSRVCGCVSSTTAALSRSMMKSIRSSIAFLGEGWKSVNVLSGPTGSESSPPRPESPGEEGSFRPEAKMARCGFSLSVSSGDTKRVGTDSAVSRKEAPDELAGMP